MGKWRYTPTSALRVLGTTCVGGWVGLSAGLEKIKISRPCRGSNHDSSVVQSLEEAEDIECGRISCEDAFLKTSHNSREVLKRHSKGF
jgi:hypothetical protein